MSWPYRAIADVADAQQGQATHAQLVKLGATASAIDYRRRAGLLRVTFARVYAIGHRALPRLWREMGAVLACGDDAFVSRHWAAAAWEVRPAASGDIDITAPYRRSARRAGIRIHRAKKIDPRDVTELEGVPIATPAFALLEIATDLTFEELERAFDDALTKQVMTVAEARETLERHAGRPGCKRFEELAKPDHTLQITRSWLEQRMKSLVGKGGLPLPVVNVRKGRILPDFEWHQELVIVEVDGFRTHGTRRAFESDRARDAQLAANGWIVLRFTWRQLKYEPAVVLVRLAQTLAIRRAA
jgi:hypothetical protein